MVSHKRPRGSSISKRFIDLWGCLCSDQENGYGYDETAHYDCNGLSREAHLNDCSALTVHANCLEVVDQTDQQSRY